VPQRTHTLLPLRARKLAGVSAGCHQVRTRTTVELEQAGQLDGDDGLVVRSYAFTGGQPWPTGNSVDLIALAAAIHGLPPDLGKPGAGARDVPGQVLSPCIDRWPGRRSSLAAWRGPGPAGGHAGARSGRDRRNIHTTPYGR
jgi:hypothetical protein